MKLLGGTKFKITKDKNGEKVPDLVLMHSDVVNNNYYQNSRVSYIFVPHKLFSQSLDSSPENF